MRATIYPTKSYPAGADENKKSIIRRKVQRFPVKDGEVYYERIMERSVHNSMKTEL